MNSSNVLINGEEIPYKIRKYKRSSQVKLRVLPSGELVVSAPRWLPDIVIRQYVSRSIPWIKSTLQRLQPQQQVSFTASKFDYKEYKERAREIITRRVEDYGKKYSYSFNKLAIRNQQSRWGSCSKKGNLNFNYRIIFLPAKLRDYVVFHELCHLEQFNHSRSFWELVAREFPDYKNLRRDLSKMRFA